MSAQDNGGPAFPQFGPQVVGLESDGAPKLEYEYSEGMTLRDYFAAKAMQGVMSAGPSTFTTAEGRSVGEDLNLIGPLAYQIADAMLKARKK